TTGDEVQRARMRQQLTETLRAFAVTDVVMTVDGFALPVPDDARGDAIVQPTVESAPLVLIDGTFGFATRQDVNRIPGVSQKVEALSPRAVAYSTARAQAAVLNDEGVWFVPGAGDPVLLDERA